MPRAARLALVVALLALATVCLAPSRLPEGPVLVIVTPSHGLVARDVPGLVALALAAAFALTLRTTARRRRRTPGTSTQAQPLANAATD